MRSRADNKERGSVIMPVVAAMLILFLAGVALTELFGAQRMQSVLRVESAQAFWIAEAGAWHAASAGAAISSPVSYAGGTYTVTKSGDDYTSTASWNSATRVETRTLTNDPGGGGGGGGGGGEDPLDEAASAATAARSSSKIFSLDLVSTSGDPAEIQSFDLSADVVTKRVRYFRLDGNAIWNGPAAGTDLPTGVTALNAGSVADRTVDAGASPTLEVEFKHAESASPVQYTLVLSFADSTSSTLVFSIAW